MGFYTGYKKIIHDSATGDGRRIVVSAEANAGAVYFNRRHTANVSDFTHYVIAVNGKVVKKFKNLNKAERYAKALLRGDE